MCILRGLQAVCHNYILGLDIFPLLFVQKRLKQIFQKRLSISFLKEFQDNQKDSERAQDSWKEVFSIKWKKVDKVVDKV